MASAEKWILETAGLQSEKILGESRTQGQN